MSWLNSRVLFYRRGALGDTLLTFPILEILKGRGNHITAVGNTDYLLLAKEVGWVDEIFSEIPMGEYEMEILISVDGNVSPFPKERVWIVEHYLRSLQLPLDFSWELPIEPSPNSPLEGCALLHASSGSFAKIPPLHLFYQIEDFLTSLGIRVVYLVGEADAWLKGLVWPVYETLSPLQLAKDMKKAFMLVGLDSGVSHLAAYLGLPTFVFYGPTDPVVWKPIGKKVFPLHLGLSCSPCFPQVCNERKCFDTQTLMERFKKTFYIYFS